MSPLVEARAHLAKAEEFLQVAELSVGFGHFNAAASAAVISGINAKDAMCLALTGATESLGPGRDHLGEIPSTGAAR